VKYL